MSILASQLSTASGWNGSWGHFFTRRSDYGPFIAVGTPAGRLFTGVHDALAEAGYDLYGNLNTYAFDVNADAVATAVVTFAYDTSTVNGDAGT